jgi:probable HAF family extracellular repeat protein
MKSNKSVFNTLQSSALGLALLLPPAGAIWAQTGSDNAQNNAPVAHYTVIDLGTLGGSFSLAYGINDDVQIDGFSTLPGDAVQHSFVIEKGVMTDLGTLGGQNSESFANLNDAIQVAGTAETAVTDPNNENFCSFGTNLICLGFVWQHGIMKPLSTLGGNNSQAAAINNRGQVAGYAETWISDPNCPAPQVLQFRPTLWTAGHPKALPLYPGDTDGAAFWMNNSGVVVGATGVCAPYDPRYALPLQPRHAVVWRDGKPVDLGSLGGQFQNAAFAINDRGQIVGASDLPDDTYQHAFLWQNGHMTDLGTLPGDVVSAAVAINNRGQVTGVSADPNGNIRGFLWQNGVMYDLNNLVYGSTPLYLLHGFGLNSAGEIVGLAFNTNTGEVHGFFATPLHFSVQSQDGPVVVGENNNGSAKFALPESARRLLLQQLHSIRLGASPLQLVQ